MGCDNFSGSRDQQPLRQPNLDNDGDDLGEDGRENGSEIGHDNDAENTSDSEDDTSDSDSLEDLPPNEEHEALMAELRAENQRLMEEVAAQDTVLAEMALRTAEIEATNERREEELRQLRARRAAREAIGQARLRLGSNSVVDHMDRSVAEPDAEADPDSEDEDEIKWGAICKSSNKSLFDRNKGPDDDDICGPKLLSTI